MAEFVSLVKACFQAEQIISECRNHESINSEAVFEQIDTLNAGYVSTTTMQKWLLDRCGYKLTEEEAVYVLDRFDRDGDYKISFQEFINEVEPDPEGERTVPAEA
jgi:Ca2+-binding EF-hand superfamily protein